MDIDKLFNDYNDKKKSEKDEFDEKYAKEQMFRKAGLKILLDIVQPALIEVNEKLKTNNAQSEIETSLDCVRHPRIELHFAPVEGISNRSTISFKHDNNNTFEVYGSIISASGRDKKDFSEMVEHNTLTCEKTIDLTYKFITKVFKSS